MIRLGVLYPGHLDLNGDAANILVLAKELAWRGVSCEVVSVTLTDAIPKDLDFLLVGHGSKAAWSEINLIGSHRGAELVEVLKSGVPTLAVNSGFEVLHLGSDTHGQLVGHIQTRFVATERVSKFWVQPFDGFEVLGYVNSDNDLPVISRQGNVIGTKLHGPVLAKNPKLLSLILQMIFERRGSALPGRLNRNVATAIDGYVSEIWKLESELASE